MTGKTPTTDPRIDQYPLFISYPRTGSHWINAVMELYFDRPRLRERRTTFMDKSRTDWMWFHDHDPPGWTSHATPTCTCTGTRLRRCFRTSITSTTKR